MSFLCVNFQKNCLCPFYVLEKKLFIVWFEIHVFVKIFLFECVENLKWNHVLYVTTNFYLHISPYLFQCCFSISGKAYLNKIFYIKDYVKHVWQIIPLTEGASFMYFKVRNKFLKIYWKMKFPWHLSNHNRRV